jgi:hypothetical protein
MLKRCASDEMVAGEAKKRCGPDHALSEEEESDDDESSSSSWVPSSGEEEDDDGECCEQHSAIGTRSRTGFVAMPSDSSGIDAIMDRADEDVNRESDFSSESEDEEEEDDDDEGSGEEEEEEDEESSDDDFYSDDDSFVTSSSDVDDGPEVAAPVTLVRCDAGIPALGDETPKDGGHA